MSSVSNYTSAPVNPRCALKAESIKVQWDPSLPVFAKPEYLQAVGDEYGWLGGMDESGNLRCILPYTIMRKAGLRMVRFRGETINLNADLDVEAEKSFLNSVVHYFRKNGADVIIPATNNALFRTYPDGASSAPYGSYVIDLRQSEEVLWKNVSKTTRSNIRAAQKDGVTIRESYEFIEPAYELIRDTFKRSKLAFMDRNSFKKLALTLNENGKLLMAEFQGVPQSYALFSFSTPSAYWMYGGNILGQHQGAMKLLQWETVLLFRKLGVHKLDFYGARINPPKGSKQEGINLMKKHLGATLAQGYMWKYSLRPWRAWVYSTSVRLLRGGDIVDQEAQRLKDFSIEVASCPEPNAG